MLEAAIRLMRSDAASLQFLEPGEPTLRLMASKNFESRSVKFWERVAADSGSSCGQALARGTRVVVPDLESCEFVAATGDLEAYRWSGLRAVQSTPLVARDGRMLGMMSTHWRTVHRPADEDFTRFDVLARQAADFVERNQADAALRASEARQAFLLALSDATRSLSAPKDIQLAAARLLCQHLRANQAHYGATVGDLVVIEQGYGDGLPAMVGSFRHADFGERLVASYRAGRTAVCRDVKTDPTITPAEAAVIMGAGFQAYVAVPVLKQGEWVATLAVHSIQPRSWTHGEVALVEDVAERTWAAVERARAQQALRDSEERFRAFVETGREYALVRTDPSGVVTSWNPGAERMFGYTDAEIVGQPYARLVSAAGRDSELVTRELEVVGRTGRNHDARMLFRKDGTAFWADWVTEAVRNDAGTLTGTVKIMRDETERKRAEEALSDADRRKDDFLAMLGHELRNPLMPILIAVDLMRVDGRDVFVTERAVIERQARHLRRLVEDLMDVTRIARGKVTLLRKRVDLGRAVMRAIETVSPLLEEKGHRLTTEIGSRLFVNGDADRLVQVIGNILANAAKYTEPGGHICVQAQREGDDVVVVVRDDGQGIVAELLPHVFDLFRQGTQGSDRRHGGLGLGLAIARNLVALHGGEISAVSEGRGKGSQLTVHLPRVRAARRAQTRPGTPRSGHARPMRSRQRILIVDDNPDIVDTLGRLLRARGHAVETAADAAKALKVAPAFRPTIGLLDLGLPEMNGLELARRFKANQALRTVRLVALTGYGQAADRRRSLRAGFTEHLTKPVDLERLCAVLERPAPRRKESPARATGRGSRSGQRRSP